MRYIAQAEINQIFKQVSYSPRSCAHKIPLKPTDEAILDDTADKYLTKLMNNEFGSDTLLASTAPLNKLNR